MIAEQFFLKNKSGMKIECQIDRDEKKLKQPIVFIAGGFGSDSKRGNAQKSWFETFQELGFATFRINFRGIGESDGDMAYGTVTAGLEDIAPALDYIWDQEWVDKKNIGLVGHSYGGGVVFFEAARTSKPYKFLILLTARTDVKSRYENDTKIDLKQWKKTGYFIHNGDKGPEKRDYSLYSDSLNYNSWDTAQKIKIPTLIVHGDKDETVPYQESVRLHELIKNSDFITLHGCKHQYHKCGFNDKLKESIVSWMKEKGFAK